MHIHTYTHTMTSLLEIAVYDRLPAKLSIQSIDKEVENKKKEKKTRRKIYGNNTNMCMLYVTSSFSITPADTKSFYYALYVINHRIINLRNIEEYKKKRAELIYIFLTTSFIL